MEKKICITFSFVGTAYCGYQVQKNGVSVQETLGAAAKELFGFPCDITGCSRTDSGVHARAFVATIARRGEDALPTEIPISHVPRALNAHLPRDIAVKKAKWVSSAFHARYDAKAKEYEYLFYDGKERDPFFEGRAFAVRPISAASLAAMREAARQFVGTHDFSAFCAASPDKEEKNKTRTVRYAELRRKGDMISFRVAADGFLYHMVRIMAGTLFAVAAGKIDPADIAAVLESKDRARAGMTAPAEGLYLNKVFY